MKIAYFINTFKSSNWGGQATSNGIKYLISRYYPDATFQPIDLPPLRFKKLKFLRKYLENRLIEKILNDDISEVIKLLEKLNIKKDIFDSYTHICFNGEGAVHYKSGHLVRFMGLLYMAKKSGKKVASINQTIDLNGDKKLEKLVSKVYNLCDFVSVREPLSLKEAKNMGIKKALLVPDGVYALPKMEQKQMLKRVKKFNLPEKYITLTGSSALKKDHSSVLKMQKVIQAVKEVYANTALVFMASTKTDIYLSKKLQNEYNLYTISSKEADYNDAIAVIALSELLVGGRQHPNIFAYIYKVPYLAFEGNTFKNRGVAKLQNYPFEPLDWDKDQKSIYETLMKIKNDKIDFKDIKIENFDIFKKEV